MGFIIVFALFGKLTTMKNTVKNQVIKGTLLLSAGGLVCKGLGAVYRIFLSNILGAEGMGLYQLLFPLYSFALVFVTGGLTLAMSKHVAQARQYQQYHKISSYFWSGFFVSGMLGLLFGLVFAIFAKQIAFLQGDGAAYFGYYPIAISVFFASLLACFRGLFQGYANMVPTTVSNIIEQLFKLVLGLLFAYYLSLKNIAWAVAGALSAMAFAELIAFLYLILTTIVQTKHKKIHVGKISKSHFKNSKQMLVDCLPLTLTALLMPLATAFQSLFAIGLLAKFGHSQTFSTALFGIQNGMVGAIVGFPSVIVVALATATVPSISALIVHDQAKAKQIIEQIYFAIWVLVVPCTVGLFVLSKPIMQVAFWSALESTQINLAGQLLAVNCFCVLFLSLIQTTTVLLQILGLKWKAFWSLFVFFVLNVLLLFLLVPKYSVFGLALSSVISYGICSCLGLMFLTKKIKLSLGAKNVFLPFFVAIIMGVFSKIIFYFLPINSVFVKVVLCIVFAVVFYFGILILIKVIKIDLKNIKFGKKNN